MINISPTIPFQSCQYDQSRRIWKCLKDVQYFINEDEQLD